MQNITFYLLLSSPNPASHHSTQPHTQQQQIPYLIITSLLEEQKKILQTLIDRYVNFVNQRTFKDEEAEVRGGGRGEEVESEISLSFSLPPLFFMIEFNFQINFFIYCTFLFLFFYQSGKGSHKHDFHRYLFPQPTRCLRCGMIFVSIKSEFLYEISNYYFCVFV
jgi:hypothetical protein